MSVPRICLLGPFRLELDGRVIQAFEPHKAEELLCYLLLRRGQPHHRETLADRLCGECASAQAKKCFRQILWRLQSLLDAEGRKEQDSLLRVDRGWVQINRDSGLWLDVDVFERASALVQDIPGERLTAEHVNVLRKAVNLYRGDLLVGWYEDWCLWERERLQNMYLEILDKLMGYCETHDQYDSGLAYGEKILLYDRASERTYQRLMRLYYQSGARGLAVRQYQRCVAALDRELGVKPSKRTMAVYEQIRSGDAVTVRPSGPSPITPTAVVRELLGHLQGF
jgi:DNA-binding SARP family transcriptional activator